MRLGWGRYFLLGFLTLVVVGCGSTPGTLTTGNNADEVVIATTSGIVADFVSEITGELARVESLIPNGFDSHTYEPKPSELLLLEGSDLIVMADERLNSVVTGLVQLSGSRDRILDLNATALGVDDFIYTESGNLSSANPHTWTSPVLAERWVSPLLERLKRILPGHEEVLTQNAEALSLRLTELDRKIRGALASISEEDRKLVVYHDAWEYFGREYNIAVVGALQAVNFAEPSAAELKRMADQIRQEGVSVFFGSEVFPSDVLEALERESGARYIADLADDRLLGELGDEQHNYIALMESNLALLLEGLSR